jgi:hypothetical protein
MLEAELKKEPWTYESARVSASDKRLLKEVFQPGDLLRGYINIATEMDTTLWYDEYHLKDEAMRCLVIAGQATMCFNLLRLAYRMDETDPDSGKLKQDLVNDWDRFRAEPDWVYKGL